MTAIRAIHHRLPNLLIATIFTLATLTACGLSSLQIERRDIAAQQARDIAAKMGNTTATQLAEWSKPAGGPIGSGEYTIFFTTLDNRADFAKHIAAVGIKLAGSPMTTDNTRDEGILFELQRSGKLERTGTQLAYSVTWGASFGKPPAYVSYTLFEFETIPGSYTFNGVPITQNVASVTVLYGLQ